MPGKTVSLRRYSEPPAFPLEPPVVAHATPGGGLRLPPGHALLDAASGARVVIVIWAPNFTGRPPFRVEHARIRGVDVGAGVLRLDAAPTGPGEYVVHVAPGAP